MVVFEANSVDVLSINLYTFLPGCHFVRHSMQPLELADLSGSGFPLLGFLFPVKIIRSVLEVL